MTPRKPWYSHLTVDHLIKYFTLAAFITGMITGIGRVVAVPYVKREVKSEIEANNESFLAIIESKYANKDETIENVYKLQLDNAKKQAEMLERISRIEGKLSR